MGDRSGFLGSRGRCDRTDGGQEQPGEGRDRAMSSPGNARTVSTLKQAPGNPHKSGQVGDGRSKT